MGEKNADDIFKLIKDEEVEYVDIRFCDLPGWSSTSRSRPPPSMRAFSRTASPSTAHRSAASSRSTSRT